MAHQHPSFEFMQSFFDVILDSVNDAITGVGTDGTVYYWNSAAEEIYGIPKMQIIGKKIGEFFPYGSIMIFQVLKTGLPVFKVYHRPRADKHVFINTVPIFNNDSTLIGAVSIEQDVTHLVEYSESRYKYHPSVLDQNFHPQLKDGSIALTQMVELASESVLGKKSYPFLIVGETGVGRETMAELIHTLSRNDQPYYAVPCHQIPDGLLDIELFGYEGGILGAPFEIKLGILERSGTGTVFLMNVHTLPLTTQSRLADALHKSHFARIGGSTKVQLKCQVIASTIPNIESLISESIMMPEFYYQFHAATILPLRERKQDILNLSRYFLKQAAENSGRSVPRFSEEVQVALSIYDWPGNIYQLKNVMEHIFMLTQGEEILLQDLPLNLRPKTLNDFSDESTDIKSLSSLTRDIEKKTIIDALRRTKGNKAAVAKMLGISRGSLYYKIEQYGIGSEESR